MSTAAKSAIEGASKLPPAHLAVLGVQPMPHATMAWPAQKKAPDAWGRLPGLRLGSCESDRAASLRGWSVPSTPFLAPRCTISQARRQKRAVHGVLDLGHCPRLPHAAQCHLPSPLMRFWCSAMCARRRVLGVTDIGSGKDAPSASPRPISGHEELWNPKFQSMELSRGWGDPDRRLVRLDHPRRDRGDTGIGRAAKAAWVGPLLRFIIIGLTSHFLERNLSRAGYAVMRELFKLPNSATK
jgi:hypothetical protein